MADNDQKTLDPSAKRLEDARRKGDVPGAPEIRHAAMFAVMLLVVAVLGAAAARHLAELAAGIWTVAGDRPLTAATAPKLARTVFGGMLAAIGPILGVTMMAVVAGWFLQGWPTISASRLKLKWDRLSPVAGAKRLLGRQAWVEFAKMLAKFAFVALVLWVVAWPGLIGLDRLVGAGAVSIGRYAGDMVTRMVRTVAMLVGALAAIDFVYQRRVWWTKMRMSHQEARDEHKESDGDPKIKARIRAIVMARGRGRMMAAVPQASVVITNPTHYAVALRYDHGEMRAPVVVAKGADRIALKIREVAGAHEVPVVESPPLARAIYAAVEVDQPIRVEHYAAVAEIISYVLRLTRK